MLKQREMPVDSENEQLAAVLEKVEAVLVERRVRQKLLTELVSAQQDIEFLENKIALAENSLRNEIPEIESLQDSIENASLELSRLVEEREAAEARYFQVKMSEKEFRHKLSQLPKLNEELSLFAARVGDLEKSCRLQEARFEQISSQKMKFRTEIDNLKQKADALTAEIPLIQNTKDILSGLMPSDFDRDSYAALQGDFEKNLKNYTNDIGQEIDRISRRVSDLKELVENEKCLQVRLSEEKTELENKYHAILSDTGGQTDKSTAMDALTQLESRKINLLEDSNRLVNVIDRVRLEIDALSNKLAHEQSVKAASMQRRIYLTSIKEEMKGIDDVDAHIRIQKEIKLNLNIEAGMLIRKIDLINHVNQMIDTLIDRLQHTFDDQNTQWIEFVGSLNRMLC